MSERLHMRRPVRIHKRVYVRMHKKCAWRDGKQGVLPASATIEVSLLIPLILAVLFLLLQTILYLHDRVAAEAWLYQQSWQLRWETEQKDQSFPEEPMPGMAVLRNPQLWQIQKNSLLRQEAVFEIQLLPSIVHMVWEEMPEETRICSLEQVCRPWDMMRWAGAILEEWEESMG